MLIGNYRNLSEFTWDLDSGYRGCRTKVGYCVYTYTLIQLFAQDDRDDYTSYNRHESKSRAAGQGLQQQQYKHVP